MSPKVLALLHSSVKECPWGILKTCEKNYLSLFCFSEASASRSGAEEDENGVPVAAIVIPLIIMILLFAACVVYFLFLGRGKRQEEEGVAGEAYQTEGEYGAYDTSQSALSAKPEAITHSQLLGSQHAGPSVVAASSTTSAVPSTTSGRTDATSDHEGYSHV